MGNTNSNVTSGVKKQADTSSQKIYSLLDVKGGGQLITMMKESGTDRASLQQLDEKIRKMVEPFLYNKGEGKLVPTADLVLIRNRDRPRNKQMTAPRKDPPHLPIPLASNAASLSRVGLQRSDSTQKNCNSDHTLHPHQHHHPYNEQMNSKKSDSNINGSTISITNPKEPFAFREVCWDLEQRGSVGETAIHLCFLISSTAHSELAKRLIKVFPKLINDYYVCDEYYGESALHMAIVNEDPAMVKFLLDNGANYHERCLGNFFSPEDQKASRTDNLEHEWVEVTPKTNYEGHVYWGEYPHAFAACLNQEECYRLLLARGADPDNQDTNGNTVTHIMVIHENINMFDMVYELGGSVDILNQQNLTPLTLAAKLARKEIFFHILKLQREIYWQLGSITCTAYPLEQIDTISLKSGEINKASALNLVVYGDRAGHLDMMEGLLSDLLNAKWNTFIKFRFYSKFASFTLYFLITMGCFVLRPWPPQPEGTVDENACNKSEEAPEAALKAASLSSAAEVSSLLLIGNERLTNFTDFEDLANGTSFLAIDLENGTDLKGVNPNDTGLKDNETEEFDYCYLLRYTTEQDLVRLAFELLTAGGGALYLLNAAKEVQFLGYQTFLENLMTVPSRVIFLFSCLLIISMIPMRFACACRLEDKIAVYAMVLIAPYFLFFCRGFRMIGPIVVMIYKMIITDLLCFVIIYLVFVIGFSQAYYVIFLSYKGDPCNNFFRTPFESIMALFVMSLTQFQDIYEEFENTDHPYVAKAMFIMYMALVGILLINMLIAMMGKTYQDIAARKNEWLRQWARIVLVVERGVPPKECLKQLMRYSQPMADGRRALIVRQQHDEYEKEELRILDELKTTHTENRRRQQAGSNILSPPSTPQKTISSTSL